MRNDISAVRDHDLRRVLREYLPNEPLVDQPVRGRHWQETGRPTITRRPGHSRSTTALVYLAVAASGVDSPVPEQSTVSIPLKRVYTLVVGGLAVISVGARRRFKLSSHLVVSSFVGLSDFVLGEYL